MTSYALRRLLQLVPVLFGISLVAFLIMALLPGDPALAILGPYATSEALASLRGELGLEQPLWRRFFIWLGNLLQGDLGRSVSLQPPVIGLQTGFLLGGAVYIETLFQGPGMGRMLVDAISTRDLLLVQGGVLAMAFAYVLVNLAVDLVQYLLDPRIRLS